MAGRRAHVIVVAALTISRLPVGMAAAVVFNSQHRRLLVLFFAYLLLADLLDGTLARRWAVATQAGAVLDYVIDRFNYYLVIFLLIHCGVSPFLLVPFLLRDLAYVSIQVYIGMPSIRGTKAVGFVGTVAVYLYLLVINYWNARGPVLDTVLFLALSASLASLALRVFNLRHQLIEELRRDLVL